MYRAKKRCNDKVIFETEDIHELFDFFKNYKGWNRIYGVYEEV